MNKFSSRLKSKITYEIFFYLILLAYFFIYIQIIKNKESFYLDDSALIDPILKLKNLKNILFSKQTIDLQPLRDISYWIDYQVGLIFPQINAFKLTNVIIWALGCIQIRWIFKWYLESIFKITNRLYYEFLFAIFLLSPTASFSIGWASSRKHLLAFLFISIATNVLIRNFFSKRFMNVILILSLMASLLSHPIYSMWWIWAIFIVYQIKGITYLKQHKIIGFFIVILSLGNLAANYFYYKFILAKADDYAGIHVPYTFDTLLDILRSFGQYVLNLIYFNGNTVLYTPENLLNLLGLIIFIIMIKVLISKRHEMASQNILVFMFSVSVLYTLYPLGTYVQNMYAFFLNGVLFLAAIYIFKDAVMKKTKKNQLVSLTFMSAYLIYSLVYTMKFANHWKDNLEIVRHNKEVCKLSAVSAAFVSVKVKRLFNEEDFKSRQVFGEIIPELIFMKKEMEQRFFRYQSIAAPAVYRAFYNTLQYINFHQTLKMYAKRELAKNICLSHIVYCNYFEGLFAVLDKDDEEANRKFKLTLKQVYGLFTVNAPNVGVGDNAVRWVEMLWGIRSFDKRSEEIRKMEKEVMDLIYKNKYRDIITELEMRIKYEYNYNIERASPNQRRKIIDAIINRDKF
jgi:hypothetical protein